MFTELWKAEWIRQGSRNYSLTQTIMAEWLHHPCDPFCWIFIGVLLFRRSWLVSFLCPVPCLWCSHDTIPTQSTERRIRD